jgi:hypothetical protein
MPPSFAAINIHE